MCFLFPQLWKATIKQKKERHVSTSSWSPQGTRSGHGHAARTDGSSWLRQYSAGHVGGYCRAGGRVSEASQHPLAIVQPSVRQRDERLVQTGLPQVY